MMGVIKQSLLIFICLIPFAVFAKAPSATLEEATEKCSYSAYNFAFEIAQLQANKVPIEEIILKGGHSTVRLHQQEFVIQLYKNNMDAAFIALDKAIEACVKLELTSNISLE